MNDFLVQAFVYLAAGVAAVAVAQRVGLGSVLGYLIAGVAIGPVLGVVGAETQGLQQFAEFGVVMMLFLVGLELDPRRLWDMRATLAGQGGLQVVGTTVLLALGAVAIGLDWPLALAIGMILSLSSTAIVLQTLNETGRMNGPGGQASFAVLLVQDIAVIPMLAVIPLLAAPELLGVDPAAAAGGPAQGAAEQDGDLLAGAPAWLRAIATLGAIAFVVVGGQFLARPLFRFIAASRLREIFTAAALLIVVGISVLMGLVGLSPALGAFLAGVVLANSEFRRELESDLEPFKGLLLGLFFITVGAGVDFSLIASDGLALLALALGMMAVKAAVLFAVAALYGLSASDRWLVALGLCQAGEFAFVLIGFTVASGLFGPEIAQPLALVVALSMFLTPGLFMLHARLFSGPTGAEAGGGGRAPDAIDAQGPAIIAGLGRFGQIVNRLLLSNGVRTVVLDHRAETVDALRKFGVRSFYGDASRPDLLAAAGLDAASVLIVAIDDRERSVQIVEHARRVRPDLRIVARAFDRRHVYALHRAGASETVRETFDSSLRAGRIALEGLGRHPVEAERAMRAYAAYDRRTVKLLSEVWDPEQSILSNADYMRIAREREAQIEAAMRGDADALGDAASRAWAPPDPDDRRDA